MNNDESFVLLDSRGRIDPHGYPRAPGAAAAAMHNGQERPRRLALTRRPGFLRRVARKLNFRASAEETGNEVPSAKVSSPGGPQDTNAEVRKVSTNAEAGIQSVPHHGRVMSLVQQFDAGVGQPRETWDNASTSAQKGRVAQMVQELEKKSSAQEMDCSGKSADAVQVSNEVEVEISAPTPALNSPVISPGEPKEEAMGEHGGAPEESRRPPATRRQGFLKFIRRMFRKQRFRRSSAKPLHGSTPRRDMAEKTKTNTDVFESVGVESTEIVAGDDSSGGVLKRGYSLNSKLSSSPMLNPAARKSRRGCNNSGCVLSRSDRGSGDLSVPELMERSTNVSRAFPDQLATGINDIAGVGAGMPKPETSASSLECVSSFVNEVYEDDCETKEVLLRVAQIQRASSDILEQIDALRKKIHEHRQTTRCQQEEETKKICKGQSSGASNRSGTCTQFGESRCV